jgi:hypothetical protein
MRYTRGDLAAELVNVTVSDMRLNAYANFTVSITPVNDPPKLKNIPDRTMEEDVPLVFPLQGYATDEEDLPTELEWTAEDGDAGLVTTMVNSKGVLTVTSLQDQSGTDTVVLTVTDRDGASMSTEVTIVVLPVNDPPAISDLPEVVIEVESAYKIDLDEYITDVDNLKSDLILTSDSKYVSTIVGFEATITYPLDTNLDTDEIAFTVTDGIDSSTEKLIVQLSKPPRIVNPIPDVEVYQGESITFDLTVVAQDDKDEPGALKWAVSDVDRSLLSANVKGGKQLVIKGGTMKTGTDTIKVKVTDSEGHSTTQNVRVTVKPSSAGQVFGSSEGSFLIPMLLVVILCAMIGITMGYKYKLRRDRMRRINEAREARERRREMTTADGVSLSGTALAAEHFDRPDKAEPAKAVARPTGPAPLCFACGTRTRLDEKGRWACPRCGRTQ